jgi:DNA-binding transcriptional MerR regulator
MSPAAPPADLSLDALAAAVAELLAERGLLEAQADRRVSAAPDARTVRYYTTLGLLDPPAIQGRQARYGRRHVLQLAAIKALQSRRLSLDEIQARLYGKSDAELRALLASAAPAQRRAQPPLEATTTWRKVALEPGLEVMVEASWTPGAPRETLVERFRRALDSFEET